MTDVPLVTVVDDDPSVSRALARLFRTAGFRVEAFATAREFLNRPPSDSPSCLVLDVQLPDQSGLDIQRELKVRGWRTAIVFISGHGDVQMAVEAMRCGAVHFLPKPFDNRDLLTAVRQAIDRDRHACVQAEESRQIDALVTSLTARERQVFDLVAAGMPNKIIAAQLDVSLQCVKLHRGRMMKKLRVDTVADLVRLAEKADLPLSKS